MLLQRVLSLINWDHYHDICFVFFFFHFGFCVFYSSLSLFISGKWMWARYLIACSLLLNMNGLNGGYHSFFISVLFLFCCLLCWIVHRSMVVYHFSYAKAKNSHTSFHRSSFKTHTHTHIQADKENTKTSTPYHLLLLRRMAKKRMIYKLSPKVIAFRYFHHHFRRYGTTSTKRTIFYIRIYIMCVCVHVIHFFMLRNILKSMWNDKVLFISQLYVMYLLYSISNVSIFLFI